jgi:hypothetical protein
MKGGSVSILGVHIYAPRERPKQLSPHTSDFQYFNLTEAWNRCDLRQTTGLLVWAEILSSGALRESFSRGRKEAAFSSHEEKRSLWLFVYLCNTNGHYEIMIA